MLSASLVLAGANVGASAVVARSIVVPGAIVAPGSVVTLDVSADEYLGSVQVKRALVRYALKVVRMDVDPEHNPLGLALDCYASAPQRIETPPPATPAGKAGGTVGVPQGDHP